MSGYTWFTGEGPPDPPEYNEMPIEKTLRKLFVLSELAANKNFRPFINTTELDKEVARLEAEWRLEAIRIIDADEKLDPRDAAHCGPVT